MPMMSIHSAPRRAEATQLFVYIIGGLLLASGLLHVAVWMVDPSNWEGPVSWRKPILFGLSGGVTVISVGWLIGKLPRQRFDAILFSVFATAMLIEVALITLQQWRGVASHFNRATPFDAAMLSWIEALITLVTLILAILTYRSFGRLTTPLDMTLAIRSGMACLLLACLLGFVLVAYGNRQLAAGYPPEKFGPAGVMKFPHGMPLHAIQFLPMLAWLMRRIGVMQTTRVWGIGCAVADSRCRCFTRTPGCQNDPTKCRMNGSRA